MQEMINITVGLLVMGFIWLCFQGTSWICKNVFNSEKANFATQQVEAGFSLTFCLIALLCMINIVGRAAVVLMSFVLGN